MKTFVLSDESLNNFGFWLPTSGAELDQFRKNPVMLWMHSRAGRGMKDEILPIGYWDNIRIEGKKLLADAIFDENDEFASKISDKVENNFLRMASCGIRPLEVSQDPKWLKPGQTCETPIKWSLKEVSICDMGANNNAISLVFYDENDNIIKLAEDGSGLPLRKLSDNKPVTPINQNMKKLVSFFKLSDDSTEDQVLAKVTELNEKLTLAETAKTTAETKLADYIKKEGEQRNAEAITLMDAAVKDGRIDAAAKDIWTKLFAADHDSAKASLEAIPVRQSMKDQFKDNKKSNLIERETLSKLSWDELDKQGKLRSVKEKYSDLYEEKFEGKFNKKPNK